MDLSLSLEEEKKKKPLKLFSRVSWWFHINWIPSFSSSHVRLSHAFSFSFDLPFINRQYVNSPRGEQAVLAVYGATTACNGPSGSPASIQLNNQIVRRLCLGLIGLCKSSVHVVCVWLERLWPWDVLWLQCCEWRLWLFHTSKMV